mgnify:CR=1 FL=1
MKKEILRIRGLEKRNEKTTSLRDVYLGLYAGEVIGLIGLHDSGKTLLFNILNGTETWDAGEIYLDEKQITPRDLKKSNKIFLVSDKSFLIDNMSVMENIFVIRKHATPKILLSRQLLQRQLAYYLHDLQLDIDLDKKIYELSPSEQHIIQIIKAYIHGARIILVDNIMALYSVSQHTELLRVIRRLKAEGISFIISGYQMETLRPYADWFLFLVKGSTAKVIRNQNHIKVNEKQILLGTIAPDSSTRPRKKFDEKAFEARHVSTTPNEDVSFEVNRGEIAVILDLNHTTNVNLINALLNDAQYRGHFFLAGKKIQNMRSKRKLICIADYSLREVIIDSLSLKDNLCLSAFNRISNFGFINFRIRKQIEQDFLQLYHNSGFNYSFDMGNLSQPEKMAIYMYRILIQHWELLLCMNPDAVFGYETVKVIFKQLRDMVEKGRAVCIFASTIELYSDLADYYLLAVNGKITGKYTYQELLTHLGSQSTR